jgi:hypothetical protein
MWHAREEKVKYVQGKKLKEGDHVEDLWADGRIILMYLNYDGTGSVDSCGLVHQSAVGCC